MEVYLYKLRFTGAVHFGDTGIYLENVTESLNSDSLFSALINAVATYGSEQEAENWIDSFKSQPPFLITSLFVYNGDKYFLPKPLDDTFISSEIKKKFGKDLKKIKFLEAEDFLKWLNQESIQDIKEYQENLEIYNNSFIGEIRPRVTLDRDTQQSSLYFCGSIRFQKDAGLYGLVAFRDKEFIEKFKNTLALLGQMGIGGEKTYGYGMYEIVEYKPIEGIFKEIINSNSPIHILLSLYHPNKDELNDITGKLVAYDILRKKGWITSGRNALPIKRKSLGFIKEGSVLNQPIKGSIVDVTPEDAPSDVLLHRVYRYGYAFTVPLKE